jgi:hypothetical protein
MMRVRRSSRRLIARTRRSPPLVKTDAALATMSV